MKQILLLASGLILAIGLSQSIRELLLLRAIGSLKVGEEVTALSRATVVQIVPTGDATLPILISAPTMRIPMDVSRTVNAYWAFRAAIRVAREYNNSAAKPIGSLLCPGLATGAGRISPEACSRQMLQAYTASHLRKTWKPADLGAAVDIHYRMLGLK
jgi:hypothetical protein